MPWAVAGGFCLCCCGELCAQLWGHRPLLALVNSRSRPFSSVLGGSHIVLGAVGRLTKQPRPAWGDTLCLKMPPCSENVSVTWRDPRRFFGKRTPAALPGPVRPARQEPPGAVLSAGARQEALLPERPWLLRGDSGQTQGLGRHQAAQTRRSGQAAGTCLPGGGAGVPPLTLASGRAPARGRAAVSETIILLWWTFGVHTFWMLF